MAAVVAAPGSVSVADGVAASVMGEDSLTSKTPQDALAAHSATAFVALTDPGPGSASTVLLDQAIFGDSDQQRVTISQAAHTCASMLTLSTQSVVPIWGRHAARAPPPPMLFPQAALCLGIALTLSGPPPRPLLSSDTATPPPECTLAYRRRS